MKFDAAFTRLLGHEGGYANHPSDPGGETMWGITARVARANGYHGKMIDMPQGFARQLYRREYWDKVRADELPAYLRYDVFDAVVNSGDGQAVRWLQRAIGAADDGVVGPYTLKAAAEADPYTVGRRMLGERLMFMTNLSGWVSFGRGWARRIANLLLGR